MNRETLRYVDTPPQHNQIARYDATSRKWWPVDLPDGGGSGASAAGDMIALEQSSGDPITVTRGGPVVELSDEFDHLRDAPLDGGTSLAWDDGTHKIVALQAGLYRPYAYVAFEGSEDDGSVELQAVVNDAQVPYASGYVSSLPSELNEYGWLIPLGGEIVLAEGDTLGLRANFAGGTPGNTIETSYLSMLVVRLA